MHCPNCGTELENEKAERCPKCSAKLPNTSGITQSTAPTEASDTKPDTTIRYCPSCNIRYKNNYPLGCPECSRELRAFNSEADFKLWKSNRQPQSSGSTSPRNSPTRKRNIFVTTWILLIIVTNIVGFRIAPSVYYSSAPNTAYLIYLWLILNVLNSIIVIVSAIALLYWKIWGFYGILVITIAELIFSLSIGIISLWSLITGLIGICILYLLLRIGKMNSAWNQMD